MKRTISILLALALASILAACSDSGGGGGEKPLVDSPVNFDTKSCVYALNDGQQADLGQLEQSRILAVSFGKKFNQALLEGVLKANIPSTLEYINQTAVQVFKSPRVNVEGCSRDLFFQAAPLPWDLLNTWNKSGGSVKEGILLGLYLPQGTEDSLSQTAGIIVRENTNRWTVVHEFMHHLFMLEALHDGYDDKTTKSSLNSNYAMYDRIRKDRSKTSGQIARETAALLPDIVRALDNLLIHYTLEEVAIEKYLKQQQASGSLAYAPPTNNWYIQSSGNKAISILDDLKEEVSDLQNMALLSGETDAEAKFSAISRQIYSRIQEIRGEISDYSLAFYAPISFDGEGLQEQGCGHQDETEQLMKLVKKMRTSRSH